MVFETLAFFIAEPVHKKAISPVNRGNRHEHHARDAQGGHAGQEPDSKAERSQKLGRNRKQRKHRGSSRIGEVFHGAFETVATKPPEYFLSAMRKDYHRKSNSQNQSHHTTVSLQQPMKCFHQALSFAGGIL